MAPPTSLSALAVPLDIEPMEAKLVEDLPEGDWQYEPKWDGFRCLAFRAGDEVDLKAKSGKPLARYFPEMVATLKSLKARSFVLDGELAIVRDGEFSFDALLQRIHPAESRIKLLAAETPAIFILFDMLLDASGKSLIEAPLTERRAALEKFFASAKQQRDLKLSPYTLSLAEARALAQARRHGARRRRGQAARRTLRPRRAGDDEGQAAPHRRLRGRRLPLS